MVTTCILPLLEGVQTGVVRTAHGVIVPNFLFREINNLQETHCIKY